MKELYEQLGLIEFNLVSLQGQIQLLTEQKQFLIKTLDEYANQSLYQTKRNETGVGIESETEPILDNTTTKYGIGRTDD